MFSSNWTFHKTSQHANFDNDITYTSGKWHHLQYLNCFLQRYSEGGRTESKIVNKRTKIAQMSSYVKRRSNRAPLWANMKKGHLKIVWIIPVYRIWQARGKSWNTCYFNWLGSEKCFANDIGPSFGSLRSLFQFIWIELRLLAIYLYLANMHLFGLYVITKLRIQIIITYFILKIDY